MQNTNPTDQSPIENGLKRHLSQSKLPVFEGYLFNNIMGRIAYEQEFLDLKPKLWAAFAFFVSSIALLSFAFVFSIHAFAQTPTAKYLSLIFTDFKTVLDNWQDYSFSILETLPLGATAVLLSAFFASLWLVDFSLHQFSNFRKLTSHRYAGR